MRVLAVLLCATFSLITGCASIVTGQDQTISINTPNCKGAQCTMTNPEGTYYVTTPGTVTVNKEYGDLVVTCEKEGIDPFTMQVASSTKGMAFGNILLGGIIGAGVDIATGAAYDYPSQVIHPLDCRTPQQKAAAPQSGQFDEKAKTLVDLDNCDAPSFVFVDGKDEIYRTRCLDGTVGVIACNEEECRPVNTSKSAEKTTDDTLPEHVDEVQNIAREYNCDESFHNTDISPQGETWMAKCPTGDFLVIKCSQGSCMVTK